MGSASTDRLGRDGEGGAVYRLGQSRRRILAVADGSYSGAGLWKALPPRTTVLARCPKNRALFALPAHTTDGRRKYGDRLPTPQALLHERGGWRTMPVAVRGRLLDLSGWEDAQD
jgi:hypothetical protein